VECVDAFNGLRVDDVWDKEAYSETGQRLGRIEAVGIGPDRTARRVGIRTDEARNELLFFPLGQARLAGDRVIIVTG
jgi:hypothetical protein